MKLCKFILTNISLIFTLFLIKSIAFGQVDSLSTTLLRSRGSQSPAYESDSRYTIRPEAVKKQKDQQIKEKYQTEGSNQSAARTLVESSLPKTLNKNDLKDENKLMQKENMDKKIFLKGSKDYIDRYQQLLHPHDRRRNVLEISLAPTLMYHDSSSSYWYKDFHSSHMGVAIGADIWLTPFFGFQLDYLTSIGAEVNADLKHSKNIPIDQNWFSVGIATRKYFSLLRKSPSVQLGIAYDDYSLKAPKDANYRVSTKTTGFNLNIEMNLPTSNTHSWVLGSRLHPRSTHAEISTNIDLQTGKDNSSQAFDLWAGSHYNFNGKSQVFWRLEHRVQKINYTDSANQVDPVSLLMLKNVTVTQGTTMFQFGFSWGH